MYEPKDKNRRVRETEVAMHDEQVAPRLQAAAKVCNRFLEIGETDQVVATFGRVYTQIAMAQKRETKIAS